MALKDGFDSIIKIRMQSFRRASRYVSDLIMLVYRFIASNVHPFWIQLSYFLFLAFFGSFLLMVLKPSDPDFNPRYVDMFFLSTSALTVSGLATVEMERLSSSQIVVMSLLMLLGGEVFVSMLSVFFRSGKPNTVLNVSRVNSVQIEMETIDSVSTIERMESGLDITFKDLRQTSLKYLGFIILGYWVFFHLTGFIACFAYVSIISSAKEVLNGKGINLGLFSISTVISSFANGGLIATNENMTIFGKNSGLLLFVAVLILSGNTLFPLFLRFAIWILNLIFKKNEEFEYMIKSPREIKFDHLLSNVVTFFRSFTVIGIMITMITMFCSINWSSPVFSGLNSYQKIVTALFMSVNARHAGENSVDPSLISPAVLLLITVMMYLPSSTTFMPIEEDEGKSNSVEQIKENSKGKSAIIKRIIMPQIVCVIIFVIVGCIIERRRLSRDPLNFSVLSIMFETVSAYGNVGLSMGYSCARLGKLQPELNCVDKPYSFVGWWSDEGKLLIVFVMLYGRLKKFSERNGKAWRL